MLQKSLLLYFLVHEYTFKSIFQPKKFPEETCLKICLGQDLEPELDPDLFKNRDLDPVKNRMDPQHWVHIHL
jgi:hypothetical protein